MSDRTQNSDILAFRPGISALVAVLAVAYAGWASAFELGHSRVNSAPGQPLVVVIPVNQLTPSQAQSLSANVADAAQWQAAGLTPPVALESLQLNVLAGRSADSRLIEVRSAQPTQATVVDMLLNIRTDDASRTAQTSVIVPPPPQVRLASDVVTVQRGDTLIGIANQFPVAGATLYQRLWALYSANPRAFIDENMNLLRSGASLTIPDDATVRSIDPAFARAQYLEHVRAFRQRTGAAQGDLGIAAQASGQAAQAPSDSARGEVEPATPESPAQAASDQVRVTAAQADQSASQAKAVSEELDRTAQLERNVEALREVVEQATSDGSGNAVSQAIAQADATVDQATTQTAQAARDAANQAVDAAGQAASEAGSAVGEASQAVRNEADKAIDAAGKAASEAGSAVGEASQAARNEADKAIDAAGKAASEAGGAVGEASQAVRDAADKAVDAAGQALSAADSAVDQAGQAVRDSADQAADAVDATKQAATQAAGAAADQAQSVFARFGQWVSNNVAAALAALLALIALITAWVFRAKRSNSAAVQQHVDKAATEFEDKLKDIDLSLDGESSADAKTSQTNPDSKPNNQG